MIIPVAVIAVIKIPVMIIQESKTLDGTTWVMETQDFIILETTTPGTTIVVTGTAVIITVANEILVTGMLVIATAVMTMLAIGIQAITTSESVIAAVITVVTEIPVVGMSVIGILVIAIKPTFQTAVLTQKNLKCSSLMNLLTGHFMIGMVQRQGRLFAALNSISNGFVHLI